MTSSTPIGSCSNFLRLDGGSSRLRSQRRSLCTRSISLQTLLLHPSLIATDGWFPKMLRTDLGWGLLVVTVTLCRGSKPSQCSAKSGEGAAVTADKSRDLAPPPTCLSSFQILSLLVWEVLAVASLCVFGQGTLTPGQGDPGSFLSLYVCLHTFSLCVRRREYTPNSHAFLGPQRATVIQLAGKKSVWEQCVCLFLYMSVCVCVCVSHTCLCVCARMFLCVSLCVCVRAPVFVCRGRRVWFILCSLCFRGGSRLMLLNQASLLCTVVITGLKDAQIPIYIYIYIDWKSSVGKGLCVGGAEGAPHNDFQAPVF